MCTIKSNWHKPNPWGGTFALLTKKKWSWNHKLLFTPARFMTLLIIILSFPLLLCCLFFFKIITLGGEQRKGCRGGVHVLGDRRFLCQQQNQLQTTQRCFAGEQREKTAESFLTSSCSSSGTSSPWGCCCQREEGSWWPQTRGRQGLKGQYYLT